MLLVTYVFIFVLLNFLYAETIKLSCSLKYVKKKSKQKKTTEHSKMQELQGHELHIIVSL